VSRPDRGPMCKVYDLLETMAEVLDMVFELPASTTVVLKWNRHLILHQMQL